MTLESVQNRPEKVKVLFVCMGNICRSPTAHGVFRDLVAEMNLSSDFEIESAGTHSGKWHEGNQPAIQSVQTAAKHGCNISGITSRQLLVDDFDYYDYLIAMDGVNVQDMKALGGASFQSDKVSRLLEYASAVVLDDVPDPYLSDGFDQVYLMIDTACRYLLEELKP